MPDILIYLSILVLFCCYIWQLYIPLGPSKVGEGVCRHKGLKEGEVVCVCGGESSQKSFYLSIGMIYYFLKSHFPVTFYTGCLQLLIAMGQEEGQMSTDTRPIGSK